MANLVEEFNEYRSRMNERLLADNNKIIKRIFNLDTNAYMEGALDVKTKELLGLVASAVLRCDDCIKYHLETSYREGLTKEEVMEALGIATLVGGTIVVPHLRRAYEFWEALRLNQHLKTVKINEKSQLLYRFLYFRQFIPTYEVTCRKYYEVLQRTQSCKRNFA